MKYQFEYHDEIGMLPIKAFIHSIDEPKFYCSKYLEIIFVLDGQIQILRNKEQTILQKRNITILNSYTAYSIESLSLNKTLILQIDPAYFDDLYHNFSKLKFKIDSYSEDDLAYLTHLVAQIIEAIYVKPEGYIIKAHQLLFELVYVLIKKYVDSSPADNQNVIEEDMRLKSIVDYITDHYKENISLNDIAENIHLNPQYTSRYFSKNMGVTLNEYITAVRLQKSLKDLFTYDKRITDIALEHGFPNIKSYFKVFKKTYNMTPMAYRKLYWNKKREIDSNRSNPCLDKEDVLSLLFGYLHTGNEQKNTLPVVKETYKVDYNKSKGKLTKSWQTIAAFGRAAEGLRAEWRNQLKQVQKDIAFRYIRFHGILSDEMMVYHEDENGQSYYNFSYVDELLDFLLEVNIKPFIELSYIPEQLASMREYMFVWKANISYPKSLDKWSELVEHFIRHLIARYGSSEVRTWYFELWDEPDHKNKYWPENTSQRFDFLKSTFTAVKRVDPELQVGGLNLFDIAILNSAIIDSFYSFCKKEHIILDFISFTTYSIDFIKDKLSMDKLLKDILTVSDNPYIPQNILKFCKYGDENHITKRIDQVMNKLGNYPFYKSNFFITEWNTSPDPRDFVHDTCYKAAFLVKNILDNYTKVNGMAYWTFTDIFDEIKARSSTFHGGLGFVTTNGLKKPVYYAYQLLSKLGDVIVEKGKDFIVTRKNDGSLQFLAYNYCHYHNPVTQCGTPELTMHDRYSVFAEKNKEVHFTITGLKGKVIQNTYRINREKGSIFDLWLKIGAPENLNSQELKYLEMNSTYMYNAKSVSVDSDYSIIEKMQPHEVLLIEITPIK